MRFSASALAARRRCIEPAMRRMRFVMRRCFVLNSHRFDRAESAHALTVAASRRTPQMAMSSRSGVRELAPALKAAARRRTPKKLCDPPSPRLQQFEHRPVELAAVPVFVGDVIPAAVADAEAAGEVPECPAPAGLLELGERVVHPRKDKPVRRLVVARRTRRPSRRRPWPRSSFQGLISSRAIVARTTYLPSFCLERPDRLGPALVPVDPRRLVMGQRHRVVVMQGRRDVRGRSARSGGTVAQARPSQTISRCGIVLRGSRRRPARSPRGGPRA